MTQRLCLPPVLLLIAFATISLFKTANASPAFFLNEDEIEVTTNFRGANIEFFTYLDAENPDTRLVVVGPPATLTFREKARRAGMWVNADKQVLNAAASYVALIGYSEKEIEEACATQSINSLAHWGSASLSWVCDPQKRDLMKAKGLFVLEQEQGTTSLGRGFFQTSAFLPPTAKPGRYGLRLWANGESAQTQLDVRRAGLERWVLNTAQNDRLFYGLLCLFLAALAGYLTNLIFSRRA